MRGPFFWPVVACGILSALVVGATEITELPEGPNRDLVSKVCQSCHDLQMVFDAAGFSRDDWDMTLEEMKDNGMNISADDRRKILEYLSTYLGPTAPPQAPR
jgi:hypothetical protein